MSGPGTAPYRGQTVVWVVCLECRVEHMLHNILVQGTKKTGFPFSDSFLNRQSSSSEDGCFLFCLEEVTTAELSD